MILSFINIRKVPREMLKTSLGTLRMLMNGKSCLIPILNIQISFGRKKNGFVVGIYLKTVALEFYQLEMYLHC